MRVPKSGRVGGGLRSLAQRDRAERLRKRHQWKADHADDVVYFTGTKWTFSVTKGALSTFFRDLFPEERDAALADLCPYA